MDCYINRPMKKFSDRPDRVFTRRDRGCDYEEKICEPDRFEPTLDVSRGSAFGRPDRKDR